jgi:lipoprotein-anchoring transpeptidase ErfK/SrfK
MPESARPRALPSAGLLRLHARAAGVAVLLAVLSIGPATAYAKPTKSKAKAASAKPAAAKPATGKAGVPRQRTSLGKPAVAATAAAATAAGVAAAAHAKAPVPQSQAEARLLAIIRQVEQRDLDGALKAAADLTAEVPNFRAAQLVYADLLRFKTGRAGEVLAGTPVAASTAAASQGGVLVRHNLSVGSVTRLEGPASPTQAQLQDLQSELKRRLQADSAAPPAGYVPAEFLVLGSSVRHAIAIDASKSRLYLFAHEAGGLRLVGDFYVSVGKLGTDKWQEGDQRTPLGIYFVGRHIPGPRLPEFYGKGALTVNFPNDWDKAVGRSGSGIWLHGSPPDQFSRAPEDSDGCLVLANPDLTLLMQTVDRQTPVLIREKLQWAAPKAQAQQKAADAFVRVIDDWKAAWQGADPRRLAAVYTADLLQSPASRASQERLAAYFNRPGVTLQDLSIYSWKDEKGEIRVVNLRASSKSFADGLPLRQYWRKTGGRWQIFSEDVMG